ncbi:MAG: S8 family serine peptidase [Bacteroidota bacterium]|nr:S8 family serine peptidase [Bacteroidota bacterium]
MKTKIKLVIGFVLISLIIISYSFIQNTPKTFYYAYSEKISLAPSDKALVIRYKVNKRKSSKNLYIQTKLNENQFKWQDDSTVVIYALNTLSKDSLLYEVKRDDEFASIHPVYTVESGLEMFVTDEVLIKPHNDVTQKQINELHKKLGVKVIRSDENYQLIKVPSYLDAIEISKQYQESGMVLFSQPNFICQVDLLQIPNDPFFNNQYYLNNTGQVFTDGHWGAADCDIDAPEAWTITQGNNNIIVAVIDEGVTPNHPDLPNARQVILNNSNLADGNANNPSPTANNNHGNACAGIIAATRNNNEGISGIAPNCRIMPIRIFNTDRSGITVDRVALAINTARQNGARVISNSWGYRSPNQNLHPAIVEAIRTAVNAGCVVVFAAGNTARHVFGDNGYVQFPANVDIPGVLTVGASDRDDFQADYSPTSALIDIVAPSHRAYSRELSNCIRNIDPTIQPFGIIGENLEIWTLDIPGDAGYNSFHGNNLADRFAACNCIPLGCGALLPNAGNNFLSYTARMGGTSAACPQVAAVAALMLSINPNLTPQQVFDILTTNADQVGGYTYTNGRSNELGFGRLNACRAVTQVIPSIASIFGPSLACSSGATFTINNLPPIDSIVWTRGPNLTISLGQNTDSCIFSATGSGSSWVRARLVTDCGSITLPEKFVWAGAPYPSGLNITNSNYRQDILVRGENNVLWVEPSSDLTNAEILDYDWEFSSGWNHWETEANEMVSIVWVPYFTDQYETISVRAENACGEGEWHYETFDCVEYYYLSIFPNPANDYIELSIAPEETAANKTSKVQIVKVKGQDGIGEYTIEIWSESGGLLKRVKSKEMCQQISTRDLQKGKYFVHLIVGGETYKQQLIIDK